MLSLLSCTLSCLAQRILAIYKVYAQVFLLPWGHSCFQSSFYRNHWACSRGNLSTNQVYGKQGVAPAILGSLCNLCTMLERGGFGNMRLGQCYPVELVQAWPESSGLFCTTYGYLPLGPWNQIAKAGALPAWMHPSSWIFLCPQTVFSLVPATCKDPRLGPVGRLVLGNTNCKFGSSLYCLTPKVFPETLYLSCC